MRDRLIKLLKEMPDKLMIGEVADYLIANGVFCPPCKVGDEVYFVIEDDDVDFDKYIWKQRINDVSTRGIFVSSSFSKENCEHFEPYSEIGKTMFLTRKKAKKAVKGERKK